MGLTTTIILLLNTWSVIQVRDNLRRDLDAQLEKQGLAIARDVSGRGANLITTNNYFTLYRIVRKIVSTNDGIRYILIFDHEGEPVVDTFGGVIPDGLREINRSIPPKGYSIQPIDTNEGLIKDIAVPISEGKVIGMVRVGMTERDVDTAVAATTIKLSSTGLLVLLLGIVAVYFITRALTRPILNLVTATQSVAEGNFDARVETKNGIGEVDQLAQSFNLMGFKLQEAKEHADLLEEKRRQLLASILNVQEEERKRISRELHDETGQYLTAVAVELRLMDSTENITEIRELTSTVRGMINSVLKSQKELVWELRPGFLNDLGLEETVGQHIIKHLIQLGVNADLEVHNMEKVNLPSDVATNVFRIIQEAATNAVKHAKARNVSVVLERNGDFFLAVIEDDGFGFEVEKTLASSLTEQKFGLFGMKERAALIDGELTIESKPSDGTTVYLKVPLKWGEDLGEN